MPQIYIKDPIYTDVSKQIGSLEKSVVVGKIEAIVENWLLERTGETK